MFKLDQGNIFNCQKCEDKISISFSAKDTAGITQLDIKDRKVFRQKVFDCNKERQTLKNNDILDVLFVWTDLYPYVDNT